ncbi:phage major capsid protein [Nocardioides ganghwensis]|uniref:Phage major capsid protein n=1 Tax=Nocardioides ganghwensis TaxID=252230 RepID=A0A4Q2SDZ9_9ACTN|nr:phage major capsid protein [Nocardioides ganghwensis]MBD3946476.1 phage major capsid protein [Nocardioides ganghwensis]RYC03223.1 phage major capsid protein [Nocardioides ganghwensis]
MATIRELQQKAAQHTAQARAINDEFEGKTMPAEAAHQMEQHLKAASDYRQRAQREALLVETEDWLSEPDYKHDMSNGATGDDPTYRSEKGYTPGSPSHDDGSVLSPQSKAFLDFVRTGTIAPEHKADLVENATGQNLVPTDFAGTILKALAKEAVFRRIAFVRPTTKNKVDVGSVAVGTPAWGKLETGATPPDGLAATPAAKDTIEVHDLTCLAKIGRDELEDSDENLAEIVRNALALAFAEIEDNAFANGSGTGQPWAAHHNVTQNVTAAVNAVVTADDLKRLPFKVASRFRRNGAYVMHGAVEEAVALIKDADGRYLLQPNSAAGEPPTLFGYPAYSCDGLPAPTTTGTATDPSALFGDFHAGYMVADRRRLTVQRLDELYAAEGKVGLLLTHRVGGDVIRPSAIAKYLV